MLRGNQIKAINLMLTSDLTDKAIAKEVNVTQKTLCEWKKNKEFQAEYEHQIRASLQYVASVAYRKQRELLNARSEMVAHLAAKDLLDRAGFKAIDKIELDGDMELSVKVDYGEEPEEPETETE